MPAEGIAGQPDRDLVVSATPQSEVENSAAQDLWIFRDGKRRVHTQDLISDLRERVRDTLAGGAAVDALISAGELEAALADAECASAGAAAAKITDAIAAIVCGGNRYPVAGAPVAGAMDSLSKLEAPAHISVSPPEGFTYYALHPIDFAGTVDKIPLHSKRCAVVGVRSIGTTLSAVVLAALCSQGRTATRITVRPTGHPYSRKTEFSSEQLEWIAQNLGGQFLVVDEGPGRSGSTFLSVGEALLRAGVRREDVTFIGSREPDLASLCAADAPSRWSGFRFIASSSANQRFEGFTYVGSGDWRKFLLTGSPWPSSWTQMERVKFISPDWKNLHKFEGMGPVSFRTHARAFLLGDAEFGPKVSDDGGGFLRYSLLQGTPLQPTDVSTALLDRIAQYCAFRRSEFVAPTCDTPDELREMLEFNVAQEFGAPLSLPYDAFHTDRPVVTDGRMHAFEWIADVSGHVIKTDGVNHGDDHFFPGPCDIKWDLAGASVEWQMSTDATNYLLDRFRAYSGAGVSAKFDLYRLAYLVFRLGFCKMAISTVKGSIEEQRLRVAYETYRCSARALLEHSAVE